MTMADVTGDAQRLARSREEALVPVFRTLASMPGLIVFVLDPSGRVTYVNETFSKVAGTTSDAVLGRAFQEVAPIASRVVCEGAQRALATRQPVRCEPVTIDWGSVTYEILPLVQGGRIDEVLVVGWTSQSGDDASSTWARTRQTLVSVLGKLGRMSSQDADATIQETLSEMCALVGTEGAVLRMVTSDGRGFAMSHLIDSASFTVSPEDDILPQADLLAEHSKDGTLSFSSIDTMPEAFARVRERMRRWGARSACGVAVTDGARLLGRVAFLCVRDRVWTEEILARLRIYGEALGTALSRVRAVEALAERLRVEQALATLSTRLIDVSPSAMNEELTASLETIALALQMEHAVIILLDDARDHVHVTHEWHAPGRESYRGSSRGATVAELGWPVSEILQDRVVVAARDEFPADARFANEHADRRNIKATVVVPMSIDGEVIGFVELDASRASARVPDERIPRLRVVADVFAGALARHRAAASLSESESRFAQVIDTALDGVVLLDADGVVLEWTPQSERLFGRTRQEVVGRRFADVALDPTHGGPSLFAARGPTAAGRMERVGLHRDGRTFPVEVSYAPMKRSGADICALFVRDVSDRKRTEQERQRAFDEVARQKAVAERERDYLREELGSDAGDSAILGTSPAIQRALESLDAVASTTAAVLIHGESGVGKELFARAVHARSRRASSPLVKVNCASIPESLFESEFFGHVRGSFTGAHKDRVGRFELADGGTLFLDEVGEIPIEMQAKLLRVLQEGEFERVGDDRTRKVDVRIVAATNRDLSAEVQAGNFRRDLFYRLSVFPIEIPPLRDRTDDIVPLAQSFLRTIARNAGRPKLELSEDQKSALVDYDWPGNVRELQHVIERAVILSPNPPLQLALALARPSGGSSSAASAPRLRASSGNVLTDDELRKLERDNLVAALEKASGRISGEGGAAELLKMNPSTLRDRMKALGIVRRA